MNGSDKVIEVVIISVFTCISLVTVSYNIRMTIAPEVPTHTCPQLKNVAPITVSLTAYTTAINETNNDPQNTALMTKPKVGQTVAVSRDLYYLLGKRVWIDQLGVFLVEDVMNSRITKTIDILMKDKKTALKFGRKTKVKVSFYEPDNSILP